jgi:hypothetical protein
MSYKHTQRAPLHWLMHMIAVVLLVGAWSASEEEPWIRAMLVVAAIAFMLLGLMFVHLTVRDDGKLLSIRFGPLPLFGTQVRYADISSVEPGRSRLIDGWGIHWFPRRGWTFNLWGFACVELIVNDRLLRIGTNDVENLVAFLRGRVEHS